MPSVTSPSTTGEAGFKVAYLVNQYPHVTHSFIRREIVALEGHGLPVVRFSIRLPPVNPVAPGDQAELKKTRTVLGPGGAARLFFGPLAAVFSAPGAFWTALRAAVRLGRRSERGVVRSTGWGSNDAVRNELLGARVLLMPSFAEGLPVALMEAQALGRPAITTYVAGIPELVKDRVSGWLVLAGAVDPLVAAIKEALTTPAATLADMGRAGAKAVAARHDVNHEATKLLKVFREACEPAPRGRGRGPTRRRRYRPS